MWPRIVKVWRVALKSFFLCHGDHFSGLGSLRCGAGHYRAVKLPAQILQLMRLTHGWLSAATWHANSRVGNRPA